MSYCNVFPRVAITGLSNGWNRNKDLAALFGITIPSDATYLIMEYASGTGTSYGFGSFDDVPTDTYTSIGSSSIFKFVKLSATKTIDLYLANATGGAAVAQWHCHGVLNHLTPLASPVSIGSFSGAGTKTIDCSAIVPSGAVSGSVLIEFNLNMKVGPITNVTLQNFPNTTERNHRWVPLDAARAFFVVSGGAAIAAGAIKILAWAPPNCIVWDTSYSAITSSSSASIWDSTGFPVITTTCLDSYQVAAGSDTHLAGLRTNGDTAYTAVPNSANRTRWVKPDVNGLVQGNKNQAATSFTRYMGVVANTEAANISGIDTLQAGATATVTFNKSVTTINKLRITSVFDSHYVDVTTGFGGSGDTRTFTVPNLSNSADGIRLGAVIVTPTTDGGVGADFTGMAYTKADYKFTNIEDVVAGNVCEGDDPALAPDDQLIKPTTTSGDINKGGVLIDPSAYVGTQEIWRYVVSEFKWYNFTITTEGGGVPAPSDSGLTASGLTHRVFTVSGLTHRGL